MINASVDQTTVHWAKPQTDQSGLVTRYCTFTAKLPDGKEQTYQVTVTYKRNNSGDDSKQIDKTIKKVINATINEFPYLVGTTVTFKPDTDDDSKTIINKHTNKDYEGKSLREIKDKDVELYNRLNRILGEFYDRFKKKKVETVEFDVKTEPVQRETIPAPKVVDKKPNNNNNNNNTNMNDVD